MRIEKCEICGRAFKTDKTNVKYCSLICRDIGAKQKRKSWVDNNPNYNKEYFANNRDYFKRKQEERRARNES